MGESFQTLQIGRMEMDGLKDKSVKTMRLARSFRQIKGIWENHETRENDELFQFGGQSRFLGISHCSFIARSISDH